MKPFNYNTTFKPILIISGIIMVAILITLLFPMFFRTDDSINLYWSAHHSIKDILNVPVASFWGMYRPFVNLFFSITYALFGLNPFGYQVVCISIFLIDLYLIYKLSKLYFNKTSAMSTIILFFVLFYSHFQMVFWFSDIVFIMHLMFTLLAIIFFLKSKRNSYYMIVSFLFALMGALTKEPAILIVTAFVFGDFLANVTKQNYLKKLWIVAPYLAIGIWLILISPVMETRFKQASDPTAFLSNLDYRYRFYFGYLLTGTKLIIPLMLSIPFALSIQKSWWKKSMIVLLAIPCYFYPYYSIVFIFTITGLFAIQQKKLLPFYFWMAGTSLTLPFIAYITPTYLFEFSFGFSIFMGYVLTSQLIEKQLIPLYQKDKKMGGILLIALAVLSTPIAYKLITSQVKALRLVVETRKNLSNGIDFIHSNKSKFKYIVIPDQETNETHEERAKNAIRSNDEKAKAMKTMNARQLQAYISLINCDSIRVIPYSLFCKSKLINQNQIVLLLQNDEDIRFAKENKIVGKNLYAFSYYGTNNLNIVSLSKKTSEININSNNNNNFK